MFRPSPLLIAAFGVFLGCLNDAIIKGLSNELTVIEITFWRYVLGGGYALIVFLSLRRPMPTLEALRFHTMRGAVSVVAALAFFYALTQLGLAEATVLGFTAALMIAPLAWLFLGERLSKLSVLAALVGFVGAALAVSGADTETSSQGNRFYGFVSVMIAALAYALAIVLLRLRTNSEDHVSLMMFSNVVPALFMGLLVLGLTVTPSGAALSLNPTASQWPVLGLVGLLGMGIWWMFALAYARAPAQRLAPLEYTALIWASILGLIFFRETPSWQLFTGALIIISACLLVAYESHFEARRSASLPTSDILD